MYNYSGIYYFIILGGIFVVLGIYEFLCSKPFDSQCRVISRLIIGALICIFGFVLCINHISPLISPKIETYTGEYCKNNNAIKIPFQSTYIFEDESFTLDIFSMKKIYPEGLEIGKAYVIHYIHITGDNIIVRIDKIDSPSE